MSGTTAIVGAAYDESDGGTGVSAAGRAYVFDTATGNLIATLNNPSPHVNDYFGHSVAVSGTVAVVGAGADESDGGTGLIDAGRAYVFDTTTGNLIATLNNPSPNAGDGFGRSVAISGAVVVVGAPFDESDGGMGVTAAGRAYVFDATTGNLAATLNNPNPHMDDQMGISVAIDGTMAVAGSPYDESDGGTGVSGAGRAYVFNTTTGNRVATLTNPSPNVDDIFGDSVAISGAVAIVGARMDEADGDAGISAAGRAYVFWSSGVCENPAAPAAELAFASDYRVLQWCDGSTWSAAGPINPPGPNTGCAAPAGAGGHLTFNTDSCALQYCDGDTWRKVGNPPMDPCACDPDAGVWQPRTAAEAGWWEEVTYGNGLFVAVSEGPTGTSRVMTSPDGITWTPRTAPSIPQWKTVTYGNGMYVAMTGGAAMTSPDGSNWTQRAVAEANQWESVTYGGGVFVAVSSDGTNRVMTSPDGITWTARAAAEANGWLSVTYGNGLFVAVTGSGTNRVMTSPDGITWTARAAAAANGWLSVTYGNGLFVAVAQSGTNRVMTSPDGIAWTARAAAEANLWTDVTYGDGLFVAVSGSGTNRVMTSPDGITWTARAAAEANNWRSVAYGGGLFVAVTNGGTNRVMTASCLGGS